MYTLTQTILTVGALIAQTIACPEHDNNQLPKVWKRETQTKRADTNSSKPAWAYEASYNWGSIDPSYELCQTGTQQSPIALSLSNGLSLNHVPTFNYPTTNTTGNFYNWGYGPAFTVAHNGDWTTHPSFQFDNQTGYLKGWHIHAPADHTVAGIRSKAELHLVHVDSAGRELAVLAIRLDPGNSDSAFLSQLPAMISHRNTQTTEPAELDLTLALAEVLHFNEFWSYQGSLTSPPCSEGIRWFVAREILFTGVKQMQEILGASTYSARAEQQVWRHRINE